MTSAEPPLWSIRDTVGVIALLAWGVGFTYLGATRLLDGPLLQRASLIDVLSLAVGLAGLYLAGGITLVRSLELIRPRLARSSRRSKPR